MRPGLADLLDADGYNYQEARYADDHRKYPHRIIYGSENLAISTMRGWRCAIMIILPGSFSGPAWIIWARRMRVALNRASGGGIV